jgi:hypothetical protein
VQHHDEHGVRSYRTFGDAVDPAGRVFVLRDLPDDAWVALYHATSRRKATAILRDAWRAEPGYTDASRDHVYLGDRDGLGTYLGMQGEGDPVWVVFRVRKRDLEPDIGSDWRSRLRDPGVRRALRRQGVDVEHPTMLDTYREINQVRAHASRAEPIGMVEYADHRFTPRELVPPRLMPRRTPRA